LIAPSCARRPPPQKTSFLSSTHPDDDHPVQPKKEPESMNTEYEGLFPKTPDRVEDTIWGRTETHEHPFAPDTIVKKDWYGSVTDIGSSW
jgi:hypothetical protein